MFKEPENSEVFQPRLNENIEIRVEVDLDDEIVEEDITMDNSDPQTTISKELLLRPNQRITRSGKVYGLEPKSQSKKIQKTRNRKSVKITRSGRRY